MTVAMRSKVLLGFATTALIVTFFLGLAIDKEIAVREPPSPVSLLLVYFVSFVWSELCEGMH